MSEEHKVCSKGVWDTSVPGITFDENGASNYSKMFERYRDQYPRGEKGEKDWEEFVEKIKSEGKGKDYDCIIGVSGGTDSSYLLHLAKKEYGLRPLAVNLDNGWSSDISVKNIKKVTKALDIDLETYVIDYEEMKDILRSYMKANLPWVDFPTDQAIKSILYRTANRENIKYVLIGQDFRSEGTQPNEWTYGDAKQIKYIQKTFGSKKLKTFPNISFLERLYLVYAKKINLVFPFFFVNYNKQDAQKMLIETYDWEYYGGHHHENLFTKFVISYWLYEKFGIDKRIITLSAQVMSGKISREDALAELKKIPYNKETIESEKTFVLKKLGLTNDDFEKIWNGENKTYHDYPSDHELILKIAKLVKPFIERILPQLPSYFIQIEERDMSQKKEK
jgi:N-acetyl sugar amidotransferase